MQTLSRLTVVQFEGQLLALTVEVLNETSQDTEASTEADHRHSFILNTGTVWKTSGLTRPCMFGVSD